MRVYKIGADFEKFDICGLDTEACRKKFNLDRLTDLELYFNFDGSSQLQNWWPRIMVRYNDKPKLGDYISKLGGEVMILERKAIDKLNELMSNIEILPLDCDFGDYWAINVMDVLECIDYKKSKFELLSDKLENGRPRIMYFEKYVFLKEKIEGYNVFKIIDSPKSAIFVNEIFVDSVEKQGITGFKFDLVWQDNDSNSVVHEEKKEASANPKIELKANVASLDEDFMNELYKMKWEAKALIGASEDDSPAKVVEFIYEYIERLQKMGYRQHSDEKINDISILLAAAWGLSVCEEYNWEWRELEVAGKIQKNYYILSPDHCYCCPPFYFMANILREENIGVDRKNDNTVLLLFNMLKTIGEKPTGEKYTVIT